jgi:hypothetical protein
LGCQQRFTGTAPPAAFVEQVFRGMTTADPADEI